MLSVPRADSSGKDVGPLTGVRCRVSRLVSGLRSLKIAARLSSFPAGSSSRRITSWCRCHFFVRRRFRCRQTAHIRQTSTLLHQGSIIALAFRRTLLVYVLVAVSGTASAEQTITVGVAEGGNERTALARWAPTARYLSNSLREYRFVVVPLEPEELRRAMAQDELDFVVADPGKFAEFAKSYGSEAIATMLHEWRGQQLGVLGAVIFSRADRKDLEWISDLRGKSFMSTRRSDFEGFEVSWWVLKAHGIDPFDDFSRIVFSGVRAEYIVNAVRNGVVDAATVRTGVLERMASQGKVRMEEFRILHPQHTPQYPFARTSDLYPNWPFAKARNTDSELAHRVAVALRAMSRDDRAARAGGYAGWGPPLDYGPVQELLSDLGLPPYQQPAQMRITDIVFYYRHWVIGAAAAIVMLLIATGYLSGLNGRLRNSQRLLRNQIEERDRAEELLRRSESALRALHEIGSSENFNFDQKVRALLALGCQQFGLPIGILARIAGDRYEIVEVLPTDGVIRKGCSHPLGHSYCEQTLQSREPVCVEHASADDLDTHPAYIHHRLEVYLGIRVEMDGDVYGTLNFSSPDPRVVQFTSTDKEILKLMANWLGTALVHRRDETQMRKLSGALEQTADTVMIINRASRIEYVNAAFENNSGYGRKQIIGTRPGSLSPEWRKDDGRRLWSTVLQGTAVRDVFTTKRRDGSVYYEERTISPLKDANGRVTHIVSTGKDVTERMESEEFARQNQAKTAHAQRISAMGALATSLAHELNQPLSAVVNYAQGCIHRLRDGVISNADLLAALQRIAEEGNRSGRIIRNLRGFLRKAEPLRCKVDINSVVHQAVELTGAAARQKRVVMRLELGATLPPVLIDRVQIEQVILNLVHNAIEAIDGAGCVRREVAIATRPDAANGVEVVVYDTGPGFGALQPESVFESFFTTKGHGMGMGLTICRSIIEAHGYQLRAFANDDGGAVLRFCLPSASSGGAS